ncbi:MAG: lysine--tRNA ligase [Desulfamplus sp.]|nr:lysine--tRNA ligase [Desulfamplus sp.]
MENCCKEGEIRINKINALKAAGIDPYPAKAYNPTDTAESISSNASALIESKKNVKVAGRIMGIRTSAYSSFMDILDNGNEVQIFINGNVKDYASTDPWYIAKSKLLDRGDIIGVKGTVFKTKAGETTINCIELTVLAKASKPVPLPKTKRQEDKSFDAVADKAYLYRNRHIDLLSHDDTRRVLEQRSAIIAELRSNLTHRGFIELETPTLGLYYGGAAARPFTTRLHAIPQNMYLRISPECALKRALCGGFNKVFEIGKNFRNEGIDSTHNPEFTMLELYEAYSDYNDHMILFETLISGIAMRLYGTTTVEFRCKGLNLAPPWRRLSMADAIKEYADIDVNKVTKEEMPELFVKHHPKGIEGLPDPLSWGLAVSTLFEDLVEEHLWDPTIIQDHPIEISPLTKQHREYSHLTERFEVFIAGMECGNSYTELNDPIEQYKRLISQQVAKEDAYDLDEDFLQAISHGMPQAAGTGIGIDRIVMILTGAKSIRDVIFFPFISKK